MNRDDFLRHIYRHWLKYIFVIAVVIIVTVALVSIAGSGEDHNWSHMVTIATYEDGKKVQVRESILWVGAFLLYTLFSSFSRSCNCKCGSRG